MIQAAKQSFLQGAVQGISWTGRKVASLVQSQPAQRAQEIWNRIPRPARMTAKVAAAVGAVYSVPALVPWSFVWWAALPGSVKETTAAVTQATDFLHRTQPISVLGKRLQLSESIVSSGLSGMGLQKATLAADNPLAHIQHTTENQNLSTTREEAIARLRRDRVLTDETLRDLSKDAASWTMVYSMLVISGQASDEKMGKILEVIHPMSSSPAGKKSLWKLFIEAYGSDLTWSGKLFAGLFYLFTYSWINIVPRTIDGYLKRLLGEMRTKLTGMEGAENRDRLIAELIRGINRILTFQNNAYQQFADAKGAKGPLSAHKREATEKVAAKDLQQLCKEFSDSILDHLSPTLEFPLFQGLMNRIIRYVLKTKILPASISAIAEASAEATKPHKLPFKRALYNTLRDLLKSLETDLLNPPPFSADRTVEEWRKEPQISTRPDHADLRALIKNLMEAIELSPGGKQGTTWREIEATLLTLREKRLDSNSQEAEITANIEGAIESGFGALRRYLANPAETEAFLAKLFKALRLPLVTAPKEDIETLKTSASKAEEDFNADASRLLTQVVEATVLREVHGLPPEEAERRAREILLYQRERALGEDREKPSIRNLARILQKASQTAETCDLSVTSLSKDFETMEQQLESLGNAGLFEALLQGLQSGDREESLRRAFYPVFSKAHQIRTSLSRLKATQQDIFNQKEILSELETIKKALQKIAKSPNELYEKELRTISNSVDQIIRISTQDERLSTHEKEALREALQRAFEERLQSIRRTLKTIVEGRTAIAAIDLLIKGDKSLLVQLANSVQGHAMPPGVTRTGCLREIRKFLPLATNDRGLYVLIEEINQYASKNPKPNFQALWNSLLSQFATLKRNQDQAVGQALATLNASVQALDGEVENQKRGHNHKKETGISAIQTNLSDLQRESETLRLSLENLQLETLPRYTVHTLQPVIRDLGGLAGGISAIAGLALGSSAIYLLETQLPMLREWRDWAGIPPITSGRVGQILRASPAVFKGASLPFIGLWWKKIGAHLRENPSEILASKNTPMDIFVKAAQETWPSALRWAAIAGVVHAAATYYIGSVPYIGALPSLGMFAFAVREGAELAAAVQVLRRIPEIVGNDVRDKVLAVFNGAVGLASKDEEMSPSAIRVFLGRWVATYPVSR